MKKFTNPLENIRIASPCSADWNEMLGDERKRFCGSCKLNVYNLSGMTKDEAERLLIESEGKLCVRFFKRPDGTVLTKDCPVGWAAFKKRVSKRATAVASVLFGLIGGLGFNSLFSSSESEVRMGKVSQHTMGTIAYQPTPATTPDEATMGGMEFFGPDDAPRETKRKKPAQQNLGQVSRPRR